MSRDDKKIEDELRSRRKFTMADGIGQNAKGMFKDVSVVPALTQAQTEICQFVRSNVNDSSGALVSVLERRVKSSDSLVANHIEAPLEALKSIIKKVLSSDHQLYEFVREVDQKYGQIYLERPHFQRPGQEAHPDDEYTHKSVKSDLEALLLKL